MAGNLKVPTVFLYYFSYLKKVSCVCVCVCVCVGTHMCVPMFAGLYAFSGYSTSLIQLYITISFFFFPFAF